MSAPFPTPAAVKILLDECVDWRLGRDLAGHEVRTVPEQGWASLKNGELLTRAQDGFDIFLTTDQNLPHQQNIGDYSIAVVILRAKSNRLDDLRPLVAELLATAERCQRGTVTTVGSA